MKQETEEIRVLDHGYVRLVETWGSDERVVEAARMSTNKGFQGWGPVVTGIPCLPDGTTSGKPREKIWPGFLVDAWRQGGCPNYLDATNPYREVREEPGDERLLRYLWENQHATPFEMAGAVVEVEAPILVFRQWHRHRTQSYNELSARYTPLPDVNYVPSVERLMMNAGTSNRQAGTVQGADALTSEAAEKFRAQLAEIYARDEQIYQEALRSGVPKELARVHLPVGRYSRMRASANLRNWLAFLQLRATPHAEWEIRQYAIALHDLIAARFPRTLALFDESTILREVVAELVASIKAAGVDYVDHMRQIAEGWRVSTSLNERLREKSSS